LRTTADTYEDQIVVSGRLADAMTKSVKTLVGPDALGRFDISKNKELAADERIDVTDFKTQKLASYKKDDLEKVSKVYQEVLGVPKEYRGRADEAELSDLAKMVTTVRTKDVSVQTAALTEEFLNYYGRKFMTRYGSKGVSIAPQGEDTSETLGNAMSRFPNSKVKVLSEDERKKAGLGVQIKPKSMGQLMSEIIDTKVENLR